MSKTEQDKTAGTPLTSQTLWRFVFIAATLWILFLLRDLVVLTLLAAIIACALFPPVEWLRSKRRLPPQVSILIFYLLFLILAGGVIFLISQLFMEQGARFVYQLPRFVEKALAHISAMGVLENNEDWQQFIQTNVQPVIQQTARLLFSTFDYLFLALRGVLGTLLLLVMTFYFLADTQHFRGAYLMLFPPEKRERALMLAQTVAGQVGGYIRGQFLVMVLVGLMVWVGLTLMNIPYAATLGVVSFMLEIVKIIGPIAAAGLAILVTLANKPGMAVWVLLFFIVIQQLESYFLTPRILGQSTGLHPFWVIISILAGGVLMGITGVILAIPIALVIRVLFQELRGGEDTL